MMNYSLILITSLNLASLLCSSPLTVGITILTLSLILTLSMSFSLSSWMAMVSFLIYVGGLMVMFAYFLAIQPNQYMSIYPTLLALAFSYLFFAIHLPFLMTMAPHAFKMSNISFIILSYNSIITLLLITLLFLMLIIAVKITCPKSGPMRPFT